MHRSHVFPQHHPLFSPSARNEPPGTPPLFAGRKQAAQLPANGFNRLSCSQVHFADTAAVPVPLVTVSPPPAAMGMATSLESHGVDWVRDTLLVADGETADALLLLTRAHVTHVLLCSGNLRAHFSAHFAYRRLAGLYDDGSVCLQAFLPGALLWMKEVQEQGGVLLVCCRTGVSCSAAVVCAYLMWAEGLSFEAALKDLRMARPQAAPNEGFARQLRDGSWRSALPSFAGS